jgi:hypothetical protein
MIRLLGIYIKFITKRFLLFSMLIALFMLFFILKPNDYLYINLTQYVNIGYQLSDLEPWLYIIHVLLVIFFILIIIEVFNIFFYSWYKNSSEKQKERVYLRMQGEIFAFLKGEINDINLNKVFGVIASLCFAEKKYIFFIDGLRELVNLTSGLIHERCLSAFVVTQMKRLVWTYMYSPYSKHRSFAIRTIGDFKLKDKEAYVKKYLNSKNTVYRTEALEAYLKLSNNCDLKFLTDHKIKLNQWEYNIVLKYALSYKGVDFESLFSSDIPELQLLALKLVQLNNLNIYKPQVVSLFYSKNETVKEKAYVTFVQFIDNETEVNSVIYNYYTFSASTKAAILDLIVDLRYSNPVVLFLDWLINSGTLNERVKALNVLLENDMSAFLKYKTYNDPMIRVAYAQVTDLNLFE